MNDSTHRPRRYWLVLAAVLVVLGAVATACGGGDDEEGAEETATATGTQAQTDGNAIKVAILSDCEGAFGVNYEQDIGGAIAAFSEYAGGEPVNPSKPSAGMRGASIAGKPINIVGYGCGNDKADRAIRETRRLMEQLDADIMIGPLSGDESIAVANYAKAHRDKTFVNGTAGAQDTTLKVRAPNFFRFNGDGAMWNAGIGKIAYDELGWRRAAVIADDYSFAWTSAAGFIVDFCARGGQVTDRVFPPLNTTDYSSFARQLPSPDEVDGYFWAVGGAGTIPSLKAFEQAHGRLDAKEVIGNLFFFAAGADKQLGPRLEGAYVGGFGTSPDLKTKAANDYKAVIGKWFDRFPPLEGPAENYAADGFTFNYFINTWALIKALRQVDGDISGGQKELQEALANVELETAYGPIRLDENNQGIQDQYSYQLVVTNGVPGPKTVQLIPEVDQSFGGVFTPDGPAPSRTFPRCEKVDLPWIGREIPVRNGIPQRSR